MTEQVESYQRWVRLPQEGSQSLATTEEDEELYGVHDAIVGVYADGGVIGSSRSAVGGAWAWCHVTAKNVAIRQESGLLFPTSAWPDITNNYSEYVAAVRAIEALPEGWIGHIYLDSRITIGRLASGWATNGLPDKLVARGVRAIGRLGGTFWHLLDGHPTKEQLRTRVGSRGNPVSLHNVWADEECTRIMRVYVEQLRVRDEECIAGSGINDEQGEEQRDGD